MKYRVAYKVTETSPTQYTAKFDLYDDAKAETGRFINYYDAYVEELGGYEPDCDWQKDIR